MTAINMFVFSSIKNASSGISIVQNVVPVKEGRGNVAGDEIADGGNLPGCRR
jgi:hypothetical protein